MKKEYTNDELRESRFSSPPIPGEGVFASDILQEYLETYRPWKSHTYMNSNEIINDLEDIIGNINPEIIFTHFVFDTHQDHIRTAHSTISAARNQNTILLYEPINPSGQGYAPFRPQVYVDISDFIDYKTEALKSHVSQYERYSNKWIGGVKSRAQFRGFEMGVDYAECFEVVRIEMKFDNILGND